ncbi:MAG: putative bifunctional diguanylate cyclase/phosphodiesterase [Thioalkalivibrionaceae bacterium]
MKDTTLTAKKHDEPLEALSFRAIRRFRAELKRTVRGHVANRPLDHTDDSPKDALLPESAPHNTFGTSRDTAGKAAAEFGELLTQITSERDPSGDRDKSHPHRCNRAANFAANPDTPHKTDSEHQYEARPGPDGWAPRRDQHTHAKPTSDDSSRTLVYRSAQHRRGSPLARPMALRQPETGPETRPEAAASDSIKHYRRQDHPQTDVASNKASAEAIRTPAPIAAATYDALDLIVQAHARLQRAATRVVTRAESRAETQATPQENAGQQTAAESESSPVWETALELINECLPLQIAAVFQTNAQPSPLPEPKSSAADDPYRGSSRCLASCVYPTTPTTPPNARMPDGEKAVISISQNTIAALQNLIEQTNVFDLIRWLQREGHIVRIDADGTASPTGKILLQGWITASGYRGVMIAVLSPVESPRLTELPAKALRLITGIAAREDEALNWGRAIAARERALRRVNERQAESLLRHVATDALTGLANRAAFVRAIDDTTAKPSAGLHHNALILLDLDHFKRLNDARGHVKGDALLRHVGHRLETRIRAFFERETKDAPRYTLARLGGDEFGLWIENLDALSIIVALVRELVDERHDRSVDLGGTIVVPSFSCGIAIHPYDGDNTETLLRHADAALFEAKQRGRAGFRFFTQEINRRVVRHFEIETALHRAIERHEFRVHYQPKVDLRSGRIIGAEALVRWQHPEHGLLLPGTFLEIAEDLTLIEAIGDWVWDTVCTDLLRIESSLSSTALEISVNISARQLRRPDLAARWFAVLEGHGIQAGRLEIELTESTLVADQALASETFERLRSVGIPLAIDDFGTGHASLAQLKRLPIETVKIDRQFIDDLEHNDESRKIVTAIVAMAKSLGLKVIAEGIETAAQAAWVRDAGCDQGQGFYYAKGLPLEDFIAFVRHYHLDL